MGIVRAQSIRSTILIYFAMLIGLINLVLLMPYFFSKEQIGMTRTILTLSLILSQLSELGVSTLTNRFYTLYHRQGAKDFLTVLFTVTLIGFGIVGSISYFFRKEIFGSFYSECPPLEQFEHLIFLSTLFTIYTALGTYYCGVLIKNVVPRAISELIPRLGNTILILMFALKWIDFNQYFHLFTFLILASALLIWSYILYLKKLKLEFKFSLLSKRLKTSLIRYSLMGVLGNSLATLISYIDTLMLGSITGQEDVAIFSIGFYLITILNAPYNAMLSVTTPLIAKSIRLKNWNEVLNYYRKSSTINFLTGSFILGAIIISFDEFILFLPQGQGYDAAYSILIYFGFAKILDMISGYNTEIINYSKYYRFNLLLQIFVTILCIILNYYTISNYGLKGAAVTGLLCSVLYNTIRLSFVKWKFKIQPFGISSLKSIGIVSVSFVLTFLINHFLKFHIEGHTHTSVLLNIILNSGIWAAVFITLLLYIKPSEDIDAFITMIIDKIKHLKPF